MLLNCASPAGTTRLRYLHIRKFFAIDYRRCTHVPEPIRTELDRTNELRYLWLCSSCCKSMAIQLRGAEGSVLCPVQTPMKSIRLKSGRGSQRGGAHIGNGSTVGVTP
jgi:hypothetical protein